MGKRLKGGAVFLAMQVLRIPAGGRGFPLVLIIAESEGPPETKNITLTSNSSTPCLRSKMLV